MITIDYFGRRFVSGIVESGSLDDNKEIIRAEGFEVMGLEDYAKAVIEATEKCGKNARKIADEGRMPRILALDFALREEISLTPEGEKHLLRNLPVTKKKHGRENLGDSPEKLQYCNIPLKDSPTVLGPSGSKPLLQNMHSHPQARLLFGELTEGLAQALDVWGVKELAFELPSRGCESGQTAKYPLLVMAPFEDYRHPHERIWRYKLGIRLAHSSAPVRWVKYTGAPDATIDLTSRFDPSVVDAQLLERTHWAVSRTIAQEYRAEVVRKRKLQLDPGNEAYS